MLWHVPTTILLFHGQYWSPDVGTMAEHNSQHGWKDPLQGAFWFSHTKWHHMTVQSLLCSQSFCMVLNVIFNKRSNEEVWMVIARLESKNDGYSCTLASLFKIFWKKLLFNIKLVSITLRTSHISNISYYSMQLYQSNTTTHFFVLSALGCICVKHDFNDNNMMRRLRELQVTWSMRMVLFGPS